MNTYTHNLERFRPLKGVDGSTTRTRTATYRQTDGSVYVSEFTGHQHVGDWFIVDVHPTADAEVTVTTHDLGDGFVAVKVGHTTLYLTPEQASELATQLS